MSFLHEDAFKPINKYIDSHYFDSIIDLVGISVIIFIMTTVDVSMFFIGMTIRKKNVSS